MKCLTDGNVQIEGNKTSNMSFSTCLFNIKTKVNYISYATWIYQNKKAGLYFCTVHEDKES